MKEYSIKLEVLWVGLIMILSGVSAMGQFVIPQGKNIDGKYTFQDVLKAYDEWASVPANLDKKGWKAYGRYMEFNRSRLNPDGNPADPSIFEREMVKVQAEKHIQARFKSGNGWSQVGPDQKPPSLETDQMHGMGRINCIAFHPTDPLIYWVGIAQGGVWKTTDGGNNYLPLTDDLPILRISDIAVNPKNPDNIFISVCDYAYIGIALNTDNRKRHTHYGLGVYRTDDGGNTWRPTGLSLNQTGLDGSLIRRILFHPTLPGTLIAAGVTGIFKSTDDGNNWHKVNSNLIWDIEQDFNNGLVIYATTGTVGSWGVGSAKLLKTIDFGETWIAKNTNWPDDLSIGRTEIGLTPQNSNYINIVATNSTGEFYGFYRSTNGGESWTARNTMAANGQNLMDRNQGWYDLAILIDPRNKDRVYVGGINMYASSDGGLTWAAVSDWIFSNGNFSLHADHHQYKYNTLDNKYYACHDGGVARTDTIIPGNPTNGKWLTTWEERSNGMCITSFYRIGLCETFPGYVVGGAQDNSSFYNRNGTWINFYQGDGMECMINPDNPDIFYVSLQYGDVVRSDDGGVSFNPIVPNVGTEKGEWTTPILQDVNNPDILFTGYGNVYKSINKGDTYTKISNFPVIAALNRPAEITALAMYPGNNKTLYATQRIRYDYPTPSRLWATHNGGTNWTNITAGLPDSLYFTSLAVNGNDSLDLWVTCGGFLSGQKVYRSIDGGATWTNRSMDLPNIPVNTIVHQEGYGTNVVYIGTDAGVYYFSYTSGTWTLYSNQLPNVVISEMEIHYASKKLYAATFGRGIWKADLVQGTTGMKPRALSAGWTWFSVNVAGEDMSIGHVLGNLKPAEGDYIKNQIASATYYDGTEWFGELTQIDPKELYKIKLATADTFRLEGIPVDPAGNPISINVGWNWIGYLPQSAKTVPESLTSLIPADGDYIKNQTASTTYYEGIGWFGEMNNLNPTDGYMLKTGNAGTLIYPGAATGDFTDTRDGKKYRWVRIGTQTWMAENLAYLPSVNPSTTFSSTTPYKYVYGYSGTTVSAAKATSNFGTYGVLYNWPAAMNGASSSPSVPSGVQGICPSGWHLPSDAEWTQLTDYLINNGYGYEGSGNDIGKSMAAASGWNSCSGGGNIGDDQATNNSSGFTVLPGGVSYIGVFYNLGYRAFFLSASENWTYGIWWRDFTNCDGRVGRATNDKKAGFSVRCLKD